VAESRHAGEGEGLGGHGRHHLSARTYVLTFVGLLALTALSFVTSYVRLGGGNTVIALAIATTKGILVLLLFMHLIEQRFTNRMAITFAAFLAVLLITGVSVDVLTRRTFPASGQPTEGQDPLKPSPVTEP
jgi:cytochrome c oxidase subunit 4